MWYNTFMLEIKIIISYIVICVTYSICRLHYLLTQKTNEEFNTMLQELVDLSGDEGIIKTLVIFQIIFSPITAPFSFIKLIYKSIFDANRKV